MVATTLPAVVRVIDLPTGTTVTGAELFEAVQTSAGVGQSVQLSLNQLMNNTVGALPTGGGTGQILNKLSGANYTSQWSSITQFVAVGTSLATTGSATSIVAFVANQGISSAQILNNTITSSQMANNAIGTNQLASSLGIASSLSIGTLLTVGGTATFNGGIVLSGTIGITGTTLVTGTFGVVGTATFTGVYGVIGTSLFTGNLTVYPSTTTIGFDVNYNTGTIPSASPAINQIRLIGANGMQARVALQAFASNSILAFSAATGTLQSPVALGSDAIVGSIRSFPYNGATYNSGPVIQFLTLNAQTSLDASGYIKLSVIGTGSTSLTESVRFQASGGVSIGTTSDPGIGELVVQSGILVSGGTTSFTTAFSVVGTASFTGVHSVVGTASFTGVHSVVGTSLFTGAFGVVGTSLVTGSFILGNQTTGFMLSNATGVLTATTSIAIGVRLVAFNAGTTTGNTSITFDSVNAPIQFLTNNGTGTLTAPSNDGEIDVMVINTTNASTLTFSGFSVGSNTGDTYATTAGQRYILSVRRINGSTTYRWASLQ